MTCTRKIGIYDCCSVVQGDCLELMKALPDGCVDAVITDPPYGIGFDTDFTRFTDGNGRQKSTVVYPPVYGDDKPFNPAPWLKFPCVILWGATHFSDRLPQGTWLIWDKRYPNGFAWLCDGEAAWLSKGRGLYICSVTNQGRVRPEPSQHPTQKPVEVMAWCIEQAGMPETILDPFAGSGTTGVAAKKLGRHFLLFEISEEYCRIARERIALVEAQPSLFGRPAEQIELPRML